MLRINYFKVPEPEPGTSQGRQTTTVPFELPGKVILDASSETNDLVPGEPNELKMIIRNRGSADAHSVIININAIGGSIITNEAGDGGSTTSQDNASSNESGGTAGQDNQQSNNNNNNLLLPVATVGARTFNIGTIPANGSAQITTTVYPSSSAGGTCKTWILKYRITTQMGTEEQHLFLWDPECSPNPPESDLSVAPSSTHVQNKEESFLLLQSLALQLATLLLMQAAMTLQKLR